MTIDKLQAGDVLVFQRSTALVTSTYERPGGGHAYTLAGNLTCVEFPPGIMEVPHADVGAFLYVLRPKLQRAEGIPS